MNKKCVYIEIRFLEEFRSPLIVDPPPFEEPTYFMRQFTEKYIYIHKFNHH